MDQQKMPPAVLRLLVIFPNVLSYILLGGLIIFVLTNYAELKAADNLKIWFISIAALTPMSLMTTYSIVKKIRAGHM
ncbi:acyl-phosphate glycerol 3-phosphate acyltransferase [Lysinibacillus sp. NPDC096418]|uniref:acyl-phosphate glycerol 3-phosphate acyltransferase n=1 Tax=Lysinibacillus sp. NPDC096418 TaxID=3364138 RepID=UPI003821580A